MTLEEMGAEPASSTPTPEDGRAARGVLARARALLAPGDGPPLRQVTEGAGWYPLVILTTLNVVDELDRAVLAVMAPNIRRYFGIDNATLGAIVGLQVGLVIVLSVPVGYLGTRLDRTRILRWSALAWGICSAATAAAVRLALFGVARHRYRQRSSPSGSRC